jgi:hypothetical protein
MNANQRNDPPPPRVLGRSEAGGRLIGVLTWRAPRPGRLVVLGARAWLTRQHDAQDYMLAGGEHLWLRAGDQITAEAFHANESVFLQWQPEPSLAARASAAALRRLARLLRASACRVDAWGLRREQG